MADNRVRINVDGLLTERFINIAAQSGVRLYSLRRESPRRITVSLRAADLKRLRTAARKTKCRLRVIEKSGPYFLGMKARARLMLPIGFLAGALLLSAFFSRIWIVNVEGNETIPETAIMQLLERHGLSAGSAKGSRNLRELETSMMLDMQGLSFIGLRIQGVTLNVKVVESKQAPVIYAPNQRVDIVAACDSVITRISVYSGTAMVKEGDTVRAGDTLIKGVEQRGFELKDVCALGDVTGSVWHTGSGYASLYEEVYEYTGHISGFSHFTTPWKCVIIEQGESFEQCEEETVRQPILDGLFLGLEYVRGVRRETTATLQAVPYEEARAAALEAAYADTAKRMALGYPPSDTRQEVFVDVESARVVARVTVRIERPISLQKTPE